MIRFVNWGRAVITAQSGVTTMRFRVNLTLALATICNGLQLVFGNSLAVIGLILYMTVFVDWNKAVINAQIKNQNNEERNVCTISLHLSCFN